MDMMEFQKKFSTEDQCYERLLSKQRPKDFTCPRCSHFEHFYIQSRNLHECKVYCYQASVTARTELNKTRTPLAKWFMVMYPITENKRSISILTLRKRIGVSYQTDGTTCHKIRQAMEALNTGHTIGGLLGIDKTFFGSPVEDDKRRRSTEKTAVLVSESCSSKDKSGRIKIKAVKKHTSERVKDFSDRATLNGSKICIDGLHIHKRLTKSGSILNQRKKGIASI